VGKTLCNHPLIASIHLTGSADTYNAIVWGGKDVPVGSLGGAAFTCCGQFLFSRS
jgi:acyl-CoA reductase-like NAD-dependent aldehyde dehydrogenase